jgi:hypothetical protein
LYYGLVSILLVSSKFLLFHRQDLLDDDEDEMALKVLIDNLGMENEIQKWKSHGGSRPGKRANID